MRSLSEIVGELALAQLWQVTLVIAVAGLVTRICCRRRPHLAYLIWLVVLLKCLTPPLWSSPTGIFSWAMTRGAVATDATLRHSTAALTSANWELSSPVERETAGDVKKSPAASAALDVEPAPATSPALPSPKTVSLWEPRSVASWLWACWAAGALAYAAFALTATIGCGRTIRRSRVPVDHTLIAMVNKLTARLRVRGKTRLVVVSEPLGPMTFGWIRPTIVVPQALTQSAPDLEPIIAHELVHIRRGDAFVGLLQIAAQSAWWFHPLVWWASHEMSRERERCCDEEVITGLAVPPTVYARSLVNVLELKRQLRWLSPLPGLRRFELTKQRLEHLMQNSAGFRARMPRAYWLLLLTGVLLFAPGARLARTTEQLAETSPAGDPVAARVDAGGSNAARPAAEAELAAQLVKRVYDSFAWTEQARSFRIRSHFNFRPTAEVVRWQKTHPLLIAGQIQHPDQRIFRQDLEWAWDDHHFRRWQRFRHDGEATSRLQTRTWDGSLAVVFDELSDGTERSYVLDKRLDDYFLDREVTLQLLLPWGPGGPYHFWWLPKDVSIEREAMGLAPEDFNLAGEDTVYGRRCRVVESRIGGYRMCVGVADGRLYARTGPLTFGQGQGIDPAPAFEKAAGPGVRTYEQFQKWINSLSLAEQGHAAHRYLTAVAELSPPQHAKFHQVFDDYREVAPGRWLPFRQSLMLFNLESPQPFIESDLEQTVTEVLVDQPLPKGDFQIQLENGVPVTTDRRYDPAIRYTYRKDQTEAERIELRDAERKKRGLALAQNQPSDAAGAVPSAFRADRKTKTEASPVPRLLETNPKPGEKGVRADLKEIRVTFDRDMEPGMSWTGGSEFFPPADQNRNAQWIDPRTCVLPVELAKGHFYRVGINSSNNRNFRSVGRVAAPPAVIYFTTAGATAEVESRLRVPKIVSLEPPNGARDVDPATTELKVTFDVPMGGGMSWTGSGPKYPKPPDSRRGFWSKNRQTCILPVSLEPGHSYRLGLNSRSFNNFQSASGVPLDPVAYDFKTR
jgi:beta-lactamase regulating signal transducer with metallopeptidase domain